MIHVMVRVPGARRDAKCSSLSCPPVSAHGQRRKNLTHRSIAASQPRELLNINKLFALRPIKEDNTRPNSSPTTAPANLAILLSTIALALTVAAFFLVDVASAMDAPPTEFGYRDLMAAGVVPKDTPMKGYQKSGVGRKFSATIFSTTSVILIAQAKLRGEQYPSTPYITVDVEPKIPGCGSYDWLFLPQCAAAAPKNNVLPKKIITQSGEYAFIHVYLLPSGWKNLRLSMGFHGHCHGSRTAVLSTASRTDRLCHRAQFRKEVCCRCGRRKHLGIAGRKKRVCHWEECDRSHLVIRRLQHVSYTDGTGLTDTIPQVLSYNGQVYAGFQRCSNSEAPDLFVK